MEAKSNMLALEVFYKEPLATILKNSIILILIFSGLVLYTLPTLNRIDLKKNRTKNGVIVAISLISLLAALCVWSYFHSLSFLILVIPIVTLLVPLIFKRMSHDSYGYIVFNIADALVWIMFEYYYSCIFTDYVLTFVKHKFITRIIVFFVVEIIGFVISYFLAKKIYRKASSLLTELKIVYFLCLIPLIYTALIICTNLLEYIPNKGLGISNNIFIMSTIMGSYFILEFVTIVIFSYVYRFYKEKEEISQTQEKMAFWKSKIDSQNEIIALIKKHDHDQRHHLAQLLQRIENEDFEGAKKYLIENMHAKNYVSELVQYCNNYTINCLLTFYLNMAHKENIHTDCQVYIPEKLNIEEMELGGLYANIIENAIEACRLVEEERRNITIRSRYESGTLQIKVDNSCSKDMVGSSNDNEFFKTKKANGGLGLKNVMEIVNKYKGILDFDCRDGIYTTRIILYITQFE